MILNPKKRYLQIALNSNLKEASQVIRELPVSDRIIIEAGTPLIKEYGYSAISNLRSYWYLKTKPEKEKTQQVVNEKGRLDLFALIQLGAKAYKNRNKKEKVKDKEGVEPYIIADLKCMDRGDREVEIAARHGASAATVLGAAPPETINSFIEECNKRGIDSMVDMMNIEFPFQVLQNLKEKPNVIILHRGVDEERFNPEKRIPLEHIRKIKGTYNNILISVAGGDTIREVQRAVFNDADIVVVWKEFYEKSEKTSKLARNFLKKIK